MIFSLPTTDHSFLDHFIQQVARVPDNPDERAVWMDRLIRETRASFQETEAQFEQKAEQMQLIIEGLQTELLQQKSELEHCQSTLRVLHEENGRLRGRLEGIRQVEAAVYQRAEQFRELAEHSPNPIVRLDRDLRHLYVNPALEKLSGLLRQDFYTTPADKVAVYKDIGLTPELLYQVFESGLEVHQQIHIQTQAGERWFDVQIVPEPARDEAPDGVVETLLVVGHNITENRIREEALRRSDERLRVATGLAGLIIIEQNLDLVYTWVHNGRAANLAQTTIGKRDDELFLSEEAERLTALKKGVLESGKGVRDEVVVTLSGQQHIFDVIFDPLWDEKGQVCGLIGSLLDVTSRRQAEQELAYRADVLENVHDAIIAVDAQLRITSWNRAAETLYGWEASEITGQSIFEVIPTEYSPSEYERMRQASLTQDPFTIELAQQTRSGQELSIECHVLALHDSSGKLTGFVTANRDITSRRRLEEETNQQRALLEAIFESDPSGLAVVVGEDLVFQMVNSAYREITPHPEIDPIGQRLDVIWPEGDGFQGIELFSPVMDEEASVTLDQVYRTYPDGTQRSFTLHARPMVWKNQRAALLAVWETTELDHALDEAHRRAIEAEESDRLLRALLEYVPEGITIATAPEARTLYVSQYTAHMGDYQRSQLQGQAIQEYATHWEIFKADGLTPIPSDNYPIARAARGEVLVDEELVIQQHLLRAHLLVNAAPIRDRQGNIFAAVAVAHDITERKRVEAHQHFLNELSKALFGLHSPDAVRANVAARLGRYLGLTRCYICQEDTDAGLYRVSGDYHPDAESAAGNYPIDQALHRIARQFKKGQPLIIADLLNHPLSSEASGCVFLPAGTVAAAEIPIQDRSGGWTAALVAVYNQPHQWPADEINLLNAVADLVRLALENTQLFQDLRDARSRFELALRSAPIGVYTLDRDLRITWSFNTHSPNSSEQLLGQRPEAILPPGTAGPIIELFESVLSEGAGKRQMLQIESEGELYYLDLTAEPLRELDGEEIIGLSVSLMDVTEQRRMEAQQAHNLAHIELQSRLIQERETERTRIARELHDGPLQELIATNFMLVEAMDINDREPRIIKMRQVQALLVRQVQELRRFCNELRPPALGPFGLEKTIRSHADGLRERHPEINFKLDLDKDARHLPEELRLILFRIYQELLNNVLRHSKATKVTIRFRMNDDWVTLEVEDNGVGFLPPKNWLDLARKGHLGLVGLQERVEMVGGSVEIDAHPSAGTRVRVTTPR